MSDICFRRKIYRRTGALGVPATVLLLLLATIALYFYIKDKGPELSEEQEFTPGVERVVEEKVGDSGALQKTEDFNYDAYSSMRDRAADVKQRCMESLYQHSETEIENAAYLVSSDSYDILYKPLPKIGWTSWIYLLFENGKKLYMVGRKQYEWQWGWATPYEAVGFKKTTELSSVHRYKERFVIIRSPWDRLASAYKNKALELRFTHIFKRPCAWLTKRHGKLKFPEFVKCIIDRARAPGKGLSHPDAALTLNPHWQPLYTLSLPCITNYTLIADFKHFASDTKAALKLLNLSATLTHRNPSKHRHPNSFWYDKLSDDMIEDLTELYRHDFELFGYDPTSPKSKQEK